MVVMMFTFYFIEEKKNTIKRPHDLCVRINERNKNRMQSEGESASWCGKDRLMRKWYQSKFETYDLLFLCFKIFESLWTNRYVCRMEISSYTCMCECECKTICDSCCWLRGALLDWFCWSVYFTYIHAQELEHQLSAWSLFVSRIKYQITIKYAFQSVKWEKKKSFVTNNSTEWLKI